MYSYEERMKAVELYLQNGHKASKVIKELGYPERHMLLLWYKEYLNSGALHEKFEKKRKYSDEQKNLALQYYWDHDCNVDHTIKALGYPSKTLMKNWVHEAMALRKEALAGLSPVPFPTGA